MEKKKGLSLQMILTIAGLALVYLLAFLLDRIPGVPIMLTTVLRKGAIYSLVAVSMNLLNGFTGLFSLGQAGFMLVGAMNPCRCGWYGHPSGRCHCTKQQVEKYVEKISGPMLDRMDLHVNVPSVEFEAMRRREKAESSADVKARVNAARDIQKQRFSGTNITCNAQMIPAMVGEFCTLDAAGEKLLKGAFERLGLTARSHDRLLRVARTIADLDGSEKIEAHHLAEAIQYRNTDILQG